MKNYPIHILVIAALTITFCACHKNHNPNPQTQQYNVNFNVGFSQTVTNFNSLKTKTLASVKTNAAVISTDTLKKYLNVLHYHVYDSNMHEVRNGIQNSSDSNFGSIGVQLANGTYTVVVDAGDTSFVETSSLTVTHSSPTSFTFPAMAYQYTSPAVYPANSNSPPFKPNTFYKKMSITVSSSSTSFEVDLNRIVARLKINIQDVIPPNAKSLTVIVNSDAQALSVQSLVPDYATSYYYNVTPITPGTIPVAIYITIANTTAPFSVELKSTTGVVTSPSQLNSYTIVADKLISSVTCMANQTTVLTGNLYTGIDQGFTVSYNPAWDPGTPTTINF